MPEDDPAAAPAADPHHLVLIIGPIASGKSTLAAVVARQLREAGEAVAVVGLDTIAEMALPSLANWDWAKDIHARTVEAWLRTPVRTVIAEGPSDPAEVDRVLRRVPPGTTVTRVLLVTQYETALARAVAEPSRGISKDPDFLRGTYTHFEAGLPDLDHDLRFETESWTPHEIARSVVAVRTRSGPVGSPPAPEPA